MRFINPISFGVPKIFANIFRIPLYKAIQERCQIQRASNLEHPDLFVSILQGGEQVGLKGKVFKYLLFIPGSLPSQEKLELVSQIVQDVREQICAGKLGASALQYYRDGTFTCPSEAIGDNMKMLDSAITKVGGQEKGLGMGLVVKATELWSEADEGYFLDNPKKASDEDTVVRSCHHLDSHG